MLARVLRWVAVLPAALAALVVSSYLTHFVLYMMLMRSEVIQFAEYPETPERLLGPCAGAIAFVFCGTVVAPTHRTATAIALFGLWVLGVGITLGLLLSGGDFLGAKLDAPLAGVPIGAGAVGAALGLYFSLKKTRDTSKALRESP